MKDVFFVYDTSCFYEIVILSYFMIFSNCDIVFLFVRRKAGQGNGRIFC